MFGFKRKQPVFVVPERCFTESDLDAALDEIVESYSRVLAGIDNFPDKELAMKAISERIIALEHLQDILMGKEKW